MNALTPLMSNSLTTIQKDIDLTRKLARKFQLKETSVTHELQQAIITACEKLQVDSESPSVFVEKVLSITGINLTDSLKETIEDDQEKIAKNYARANQFEITYSGFNESDAQSIIDMATSEKDDAIANLILIFGSKNRQLQRINNGQTIKHFNAKITELQDIFSIAAIYPDNVIAKSLGAMGTMQRFRLGIESETFIKMKNARYLIDSMSEQAKSAILSTQDSNVTQLTPSVVTDAVNSLQKTVNQSEGLIEKHRQRISEYRYAMRIYEEAKRDVYCLSNDELIASLLFKLNRVSLSIDINLFEQSFSSRITAKESDEQLSVKICKLYAFRCLLQNVFAVITKVIVTMDEIYEKRRHILNKVCRTDYKLGTKPTVDVIFDTEIYHPLIEMNKSIRSMISTVKLDIDNYECSNTFSDFIELFNDSLIRSGLVEPTAHFSIIRDPHANFEYSTLYEMLTDKTKIVILESERQLLAATKLERDIKSSEENDSQDEHWSNKVSSNINDGVSVMFDKESMQDS